MSLDDIHLLNPFDPLDDLSELVDPPETYTVRQYTKLGTSFFGIQLKSPPAYKNLPSSVTDPFSVTQRRILVVRTSDNFVYSEVSFTTGPSAGQFRADYYNVTPGTGVVLSNFKSTGLIQFNASEDGEEVDVYYWSSGPGVLPQNLVAFISDQTVPGDLAISGDLAVTGDTSCDGLTAQSANIETIESSYLTAAQVNFLAGYVRGGVPANNASDPTNDLDFTACVCVADDDLTVISVAAMTKRIDATFTAGSGNGMRTGASSLQNGTYYLYAIWNPTTDTGDFLAVHYDDILTFSLPTGYTKKRLIWKIPRISGTLQGILTQGAGDLVRVELKTRANDSVYLNLTGTRSSTAFATAPVGKISEGGIFVEGSVFMTDSELSAVMITGYFANDVAPSTSDTAGPSTLRNKPSTSDTIANGYFAVMGGYNIDGSNPRVFARTDGTTVSSVVLTLHAYWINR